MVETWPLQCDAGTGQCTSKTIGQDFGDVFALMAPCNNFDGIQNPASPVSAMHRSMQRRRCCRCQTSDGAHGHDPELPEMSATFIADGPQIREATIRRMHNIDVAPTIMQILGVTPHQVDGEVLHGSCA